MERKRLNGAYHKVLGYWKEQAGEPDVAMMNRGSKESSIMPLGMLKAKGSRGTLQMETYRSLKWV